MGRVWRSLVRGTWLAPMNSCFRGMLAARNSPRTGCLTARASVAAYAAPALRDSEYTDADTDTNERFLCSGWRRQLLALVRRRALHHLNE